MKELMQAMMTRAVVFGRDEEGAQIVEYGRTIPWWWTPRFMPLAKIAGGGGPFGAFIARVTACLTTAVCV